MTQMRNYIEELTGRVEQGKKAGQSLAELQKTLTMASIKTLQADGYGSYIAENLKNFTVYLGQKTALEDRLSGTIEAIYKSLDRT
jgi:type II secretory pathway component PulF